MGERGHLIVIDGIDGAGKEVARDAIVEFFQDISDNKTQAEHSSAGHHKGETVLNLDEYWQKNHRHPQFEQKKTDKKEYLLDYVNPADIDIITASEPTHTDIGNAIRNEIVRYKGRYSARTTAQTYALDREILYKRVELPARDLGKLVVKCRSVSTTKVFQQIQATELGEKLTDEEILSFEGNKIALANPPNLLIIPTVKDIEKVLYRTKKRKKDDNTWFEKVDFQRKVEEKYESAEFREFFEKLGTKIIYVDNDANVSEQEFRERIKISLAQIYKK